MDWKNFLKSDRKIIVASLVIPLIGIISTFIQNCTLPLGTDVSQCTGPFGLIGTIIGALFLIPSIPLAYLTTLIIGRGLSFDIISALLTFVYSFIGWYIIIKIVLLVFTRKKSSSGA